MFDVIFIYITFITKQCAIYTIMISIRVTRDSESALLID